MKKSYLVLISSMALLGASAVAYTAAPTESQSAIETKDAEQNMATGITPVGKPMRAPGSSYTLPFSITPTQEQFEECTIVNVTDGTSTWIFENNNFRYKWDSSNPGDDYLYLPTLEMPAGPVKVQWDNYTGGFDEAYKVYLSSGSEVDTANPGVLLYDSGHFQSPNTYNTIEVSHNVETAGSYRLVFYCYSKADMFELKIRNISIAAIDNQLPKAPEITSIDFDSMDGSITVTAPSQNISDEALSGDVTLYVNIDDEAVAGSPFTLAPGQAKVIENLHLTNTTHTVTAKSKITINGSDKYSDEVSQNFRVTKKIQIPMPLPAFIEPDADEFAVCTVINSNDDSNKFVYNNTVKFNEVPISAFQYSSSYMYPADDWVILPAMIADVKGAYKVDFNLATQYYNENVDVYVADAPTAEAMLATEPIKTFRNYQSPNSWSSQTARFGHDAGNFYIGFHVTSEKNMGFVYISDITVSKEDDRIPDVPSFTTEFDGSEGTIAVTLPSNTLGGTPIAASTVNAVLKIDGEVYGQTITGAPGQTINVEANLERGKHTISVYANYTIDGTTLTSETISSDILITRPSSFFYTLPMTMAFNAADFKDLLVIDVNDDGKTWTCENDVAKYSYSSSNNGDDWMITLPVQFSDANKTYKVSIEAKTQGSDEEKFAIYLGTSRTPEGMTQEILKADPIKNPNDYITLENTFTVPAAGTYYIGIHDYSDKYKYNLYLKNMVIEEAAAETVPGLATDLILTPDQTGALNATVSFKMPSVDKSGNNLPADQQLTATVAGSAETKTVTGTPGEQVSCTLGCAQGNQTFSVTVANADGSGQAATVSGYCGLDTPMTPKFTDAYVSEDGYGVILKWDPVTEGIHGGALNLPAMMYRISEYDYDDMDWYAVEHLAETEYEYRVDEGTSQQFYTLGLEAYNSASTNSGIYSLEVACGKPYETPVEETFANGQIHYQTLYSLSTQAPVDRPSWSIAAPGSVIAGAALEGGQQAMIGRTTKVNANSQLMFPLIATTNATAATFSIDVYVGDFTPSMSIFANTYGLEEAVLLGNIDTTEIGWHTYTFALPAELLNRPWVQVGISMVFANINDTAIIKGYKMTAEISDSVEDITDGNIRVAATEGAICISGAQGRKVAVADIAGKRIFAGEGTDNMRIAATAGVHIVNIDGKAYKLIVR